MKLIIAIVHDEDSNNVVNSLNKEGFSVTKLKTTGGFLRAGNATLLCGVEEELVDKAIKIIKEESQTRKEMVTAPIPLSEISSYVTFPMEIEVGGATIFVVDVERFEKV